MHGHNNTVHCITFIYNLYETQTNTRYSMLTHEIEARKRLHDHVMVESNPRRSEVLKVRFLVEGSKEPRWAWFITLTPSSPSLLVLLFPCFHPVTEAGEVGISLDELRSSF